MNIPHALAQVIRRSPSLSKLLEATVELVAREMGTDVCSVYLLEPAGRRLRLAATHGLDRRALGKVTLEPGEGITGIVVSEMRAIAVEDASKHPSYRYFPETGEEQFHSYLGVPMAIRNRPVGAIVVQSTDRRRFTRDEIETLHTIAAQLVGVVENARLIDALDHPDRGNRYLEELRSWRRETGQRDSENGEGEVVYHGNAASPGIAIGRIVFRGRYDPPVDTRASNGGDPARERERVDVAMEKTLGDVQRIQEAAEKETDEEHALIFSSHLLLLNDPTLEMRLHEAVDEGLDAAAAVDRVFATLESQLGNVTDAYLQERAEDIRDLRDRLLGHILEAGAQERIAQSIVFAHGISPSLVVELKVQGALGIVTERGGMTSHGALLARAMGIPAVTGVEGILADVHSGEDAIADGQTGTVVLRPAPRTLVRYQKKAEKVAATRSRLEKLRDEPARSTDGEVLPLLANVSLASEIREAVFYGAEGIGLYRTEFPFMIREDFPTREEQSRIYRRALTAFPDGVIQFRILDLGGDKYHPRITRADELNPVLGYRSIRLLLDHPKILKEQVRAFVQVAGRRRIGILIPMISSLEELRRARELIAEAIGEVDDDTVERDHRIGLMIELPAAVEIAAELSRQVDFLSIGTNDLIQFTLAADRENARVSPFGDPYHPAVLRMIRRTIEAGHGAGIPVGCCGEMAATPDLAALLFAMEVDNLSLTPRAIPTVKDAVRRVRILPLRKKIDEVLALPESGLIRARIREELERTK